MTGRSRGAELGRRRNPDRRPDHHHRRLVRPLAHPLARRMQYPPAPHRPQRLHDLHGPPSTHQHLRNATKLAGIDRIPALSAASFRLWAAVKDAPDAAGVVRAAELAGMHLTALHRTLHQLGDRALRRRRSLVISPPMTRARVHTRRSDVPHPAQKDAVLTRWPCNGCGPTPQQKWFSIGVPEQNGSGVTYDRIARVESDHPDRPGP